MKPDPIPARLHVVLAREASKAVIFRRGPSSWVRAILWHTDTDRFEGGQWLHGRIYGERCDLSPDGSLLLYFEGQHHNCRDSYLGTWTAISRPPYFTALALWPLGNTWSGGGMFIDNRTICLHHCGNAEPHPDHRPPKQLRVIVFDEELTKRDRARVERIKAQGWQLVHSPADGQRHFYGRRVDDPMIWHRAHPTNERYYLIEHYCGYVPEHYPGPAIMEYALGDWIDNGETPLEGANWADWDQQGRLAYIRDGQIFAQEPQQIGAFARPLADFNDQEFESILPPEWATRW